jgi:hypothetical protein
MLNLEPLVLNLEPGKKDMVLGTFYQKKPPFGKMDGSFNIF